MDSKLFQDFVTFANGQIDSGDLDPMYPVLREVYRREGVEREQALWRTFLFVAWYHVGSAILAWRQWPEPTEVKVPGAWPTGVERRGFRGQPRLVEEHVSALLVYVRRHKSLAYWIGELVSGKTPEQGWDAVRAAYSALPFAGPWSSYKWADLLKHVHGVPISASDLGVGGNSPTAGPIPGMVHLTGRTWYACANRRRLQRALYRLARCAGCRADGLDQLETALCDFNSLCKGRYYVGHDLDQQAEQLKLVHAPDVFWDARRRVFPARHLAELGPREPKMSSALRKAWYAERGEVLL